MAHTTDRTATGFNLLLELLRDFPVMPQASTPRADRLDIARAFKRWTDRFHAVVQLHRDELQPHARRFELFRNDLVFVPTAILDADAVDLALIAERLQEARERLNAALANLAPGDQE